MKRILVLDNYDSFTYNLVHVVEKLLGYPVEVYRNDKIPLEKVETYDKVILSPGPGIPDEAGILKTLIKEFAASKSILGVCLGHQAIGEVFGGTLLNLDKVYHGLATPMKLLDRQEEIFRNIPETFMAGRYHSWIVDKKSLPECFTVTVEDEEGKIMGISHRKYDLKGVQFHPESILTPEGGKILANWLSR